MEVFFADLLVVGVHDGPDDRVDTGLLTKTLLLTVTQLRG